jgi:hypothetical protein
MFFRAPLNAEQATLALHFLLVVKHNHLHPDAQLILYQYIFWFHLQN